MPRHSAHERAIDDARRHFLAGRGPGATRTEVTQHTRARTTLAGHPTAEQRANTSLQTATIRGDLDALTDQAAAARHRFTATMAALTDATRDTRRTVRVALIAGTAGITAGITATIIATNRHRANPRP